MPKTFSVELVLTWLIDDSIWMCYQEMLEWSLTARYFWSVRASNNKKWKLKGGIENLHVVKKMKLTEGGILKSERESWSEDVHYKDHYRERPFDKVLENKDSSLEVSRNVWK